MIAPFLLRYGVYAALFGAVFYAGIWYGRYHEQAAQIAAMQRLQAAVESARLEAVQRIHAVEASAERERRTLHERIKRLKATDPGFAAWYDDGVPFGGIDIIWLSDVPDAGRPGPGADSAVGLSATARLHHQWGARGRDGVVAPDH